MATTRRNAGKEESLATTNHRPGSSLEVTLDGGNTAVHPYWNMVALSRLKKEFQTTVQDVLQDVFDPDKIVPFYWVGLESRIPGEWTYEQVMEHLEFTDLMILQSKMTALIKEFGLDQAPLQTNNGVNSGPSGALTSVSPNSNSGS